MSDQVYVGPVTDISVQFQMTINNHVPHNGIILTGILPSRTILREVG